MKRTWRMVAAALLLALSVVRCSTMDGPEAAAKISFSEWAVKIRIPYRNENFETLDNDGRAATVRIKVEVWAEGEWKEKQAQIQCEKVDDDWQCDRGIQLNQGPVDRSRRAADVNQRAQTASPNAREISHPLAA
ncbi:MAG: hypothetical protein IH588_00945 [Anaerolineales bacterium]|nr:hypothetical protein [Anaerolineales bacterium]